MKRALSFLVLTLVFPAVAAPLKITLPVETPELKEAPGREVLMANCVICHSLDYITTQPPLAAAGWNAIVVKMQKIFGAPLPDDQIKTVVDYLAANYGSTDASPPPKGS